MAYKPYVKNSNGQIEEIQLFAEYGNKDSDGNIIKQTYAKLTNLNQNITANKVTASEGLFTNINSSLSDLQVKLNKKIESTTIVLEAQGKIILNNGLKIAWGHTGVSSGTITCQFNGGSDFFSNTNYSIAMCAVCGSSSATNAISYRQNAFNKTKSGFQTARQDDISNGSDWIAIGY